MNHVVSTEKFRASRRSNRDRTTKSVLFVCWSNVCRSPAGKSILQAYLKENDVQASIHVDSAGIHLDDIPPKPSFFMRWAAFRRNCRMKKRARRILRTDLDKFDLVIAMDEKVLIALGTLHAHPKSDIRLLSDFLPERWPSEVPDPMNRSLRTCNFVLDMLETACPNIVNELLTA